MCVRVCVPGPAHWWLFKSSKLVCLSFKDMVAVPGVKIQVKHRQSIIDFLVTGISQITLLYLGLYIIYCLKFDVNGLKSSEKMTTEC